MPRPQRPWFRFYVEAVHDRKLRRLPAAQRWVWVVVLAAARESHRPGVLLVAEGQPLDEHDLADKAAVPVRDVCRALDAFTAAGMLDRDDAGAYRVCKWGERQFETDNVTERTRRHRSREQGRNVPTSFPGTGNPHASASRALATESDTDRDSSSSDSRGPEPGPDDGPENRESRTEDPGPPGPNRKVETALAVLVDRDLSARQARPDLDPIGDVEAWTRKALQGRRARHGVDLVRLARDHPRLTPTELADRLDDRYDHTLDDHQAAARARAEAGMQATRELAETPPDPELNAAGTDAARRALRPVPASTDD